LTAEIAILNRTAVALAADSAVTLGIRGHQKIYNSVDKLFQLVSAEPAHFNPLSTLACTAFRQSTQASGTRKSQ
jgi:hypothetical protein